MAARQTYYTYILSHFHKGRINHYFFKVANQPNLTLNERVKAQLVRLLGVPYKPANEELVLEKSDRVRIITL